MKNNFFVTLSALSFLCTFNLQFTASEEQWVTDARETVLHVSKNDECHSGRFGFKLISEARQRAYDACRTAYESFVILPEEERRSCLNPQTPDCRWFFHEEKGYFKACSLICSRLRDSPLGPKEHRSIVHVARCPLINPSRSSWKVPLSEIILTLRSGYEIPIASVDSLGSSPSPSTLPSAVKPMLRPPTPARAEINPTRPARLNTSSSGAGSRPRPSAPPSGHSDGTNWPSSHSIPSTVAGPKVGSLAPSRMYDDILSPDPAAPSSGAGPKLKPSTPTKAPSDINLKSELFIRRWHELRNNVQSKSIRKRS